MSKFIVRATQLITQDVTFVVEVDDQDSPEKAAKFLAEEIPSTTSVQLYDSQDEVYLRNIVTEVRPATEEESK